MKIRTNFCILFTLLLWLAFNANSQSADKSLPPNKITDAQTAVAKLRELYQNRDYESGYQLGQKLTGQFPDNPELQAWFVVNMARNDMSKEAVEAAEKLVENNKENAWAWFAAANAYIRNLQKDEAVSAGEKALKLNPDDEDFILLFGSSLLMQRKYDEIYALLNRNSSKIKDKSRLLVMKAEAQYRQSVDEKNDEGRKKLSFKNFAKAREISPNSVNANYVYGVYLNFDKRFAEAYPFLKNAVALSPNVLHIRQDFWKTILQGQPTKTEKQKQNEVIADINTLMRLRPDSVKVLETVSTFYKGFEMPDKSSEVDAVILKKFPQSAQAERVLIWQIRRFDYFGENRKADEQKRLRLVQMIRDFINRPNHFNEGYLGEAYSNLFFQIKDNKNISDAELLQIAEEASKSPQIVPDKIYSMIVAALIDRKMFREGEKFVNIGFEKVKKESAAQRNFIKNEEEIKRNLNEMNSTLHGINGWLFFKEARFDEAEKELETAVELNNHDLITFDRLGQIYEAKNKFDKAEDAYIKGYSSFPSSNELNLKSLKSLYEKRGGNPANFESYFEKVKVIERETRKERILSAKNKAAKNALPFTLKSLDAKLISLADLKGKIVVVNIWGTWCAPCVKEMPEMQELHKKYLNDKDVVILTINNDEDLAKVKKFMNERKFNFTVLRDENYLDNVEFPSFPRTWFVDREGKIAFDVGFSDKLVEEFGWRIEELKR
ncbi:MAG: redoxin domain-containing protein [Pyrinomonadaceae bacterium]